MFHVGFHRYNPPCHQDITILGLRPQLVMTLMPRRIILREPTWNTRLFLKYNSIIFGKTDQSPAEPNEAMTDTVPTATGKH